MGKHKKTREQKIIADLRRKLQTSQPQKEPTFELNAPQKAAEPMFKAQTSVLSYPYLVHDLIKTMTLTGALVAAELILFFLLRKQLIMFPTLGF